MKSRNWRGRGRRLKSLIKNLDNKRALVTGATGGIGKAIVKSFVEAGIKVVACGSDAQRLDGLHREFPRVIIEKADFNKSDEVFRLAENSLKHYDSLDILVNNAGIGVTKDVVDLELSDYESMMNINLRSVFILSKIIGRAMISQGSGYIINIGSGASTTPIAGMATYCASKYGLLGFSESLGQELRSYGVKVSIIMPGSTATHFGGGDPRKRINSKPGILLPEDIADTIMYLLSQSKRAWSSQVNLRPLDLNKSQD
ncbi:MAG: short-chain dehydrogenase [Candidatus Zixiibacteriota bacterium]|nr:MAG: short-chain dehydrogenase [candidate division Zixibacteria bacterium]